MTDPIVSVHQLYKRYGGVVALNGMSLEAERGTIHAVVGENGAGKSTLMKILGGVVRTDSGTIALDSETVSFDSPNASRARGIGIVHQELSLFPERSVLANLFVNREPTRRGLISIREMRQRSEPTLQQLGLHIDSLRAVGELTIGERQLVELCRVLLENPRLLILDEPNSALNERETTRLFDVLRQLRSRGITMLYVSHRLEEVFAIADHVTVARNGREVFSKPIRAVTIPEVIEGMVGGRQESLFPPSLPLINTQQEERLTLRGVSTSRLRDISFEARSGEIVGFAGLEGSGVSALLGLLFGMRKIAGGEVTYPDGNGVPSSPTQAARRGIALVPADRRRNGLMLDKSLVENVAQVAYGALGRSYEVLRQRELVSRAERQIANLRIITRSPFKVANQLSGGNQQKVVVAKWLEVAPRVVLLDDPTRGVDVGAKREIYQIIRQLSAEGRIVLFSSTELPELIGLCDRIIVFYRGRLAGELRGDAINEHDLLHLINTGESVTESHSPI
jgi:ribose transport system ATP-binding protein